MFSEQLQEKIEQAEKIIAEIENLKRRKKELNKDFENLNKDFNKGKLKEEEYKKRLNEEFKEGKEARDTSKTDKQIRELLEKLKEINAEVIGLFSIQEHLEKKEQLEINLKEVKQFIRRTKGQKKDLIKIKYSTYSYNFLGKYANKWFDNLSKSLARKYPDYFKPLYYNLRLANIRVFSNTYINLGLMGSFFGTFLAFISGFFLFKGLSIFNIIKILVLSLFTFIVLIFIFYYYPKVIVDSRRRDIKNDLPFATLHMAAVAGSGAKLVDIFGMLLKSEEYKALSGEIKRIMNYVNLFGYNFTTALKSVAETTPSNEFKELLNGMIGSIESGGSIKSFLKNKAADTMNRYRLERQKYVETLSTYSDIYTALLIAAPLLFVIILVLISIVGSKIGGLEIGFVEKIGTFVVVPAMNIGFIFFMNIVQPDL